MDHQAQAPSNHMGTSRSAVNDPPPRTKNQPTRPSNNSGEADNPLHRCLRANA